MSDFNNEVVLATLKQLLNILKSGGVKYRILGSVVMASMNRKLHRKLGDFDLIIDAGKKEYMSAELKKIGYVPSGGLFKFFRKYFNLDQYESDSLLGVGYFYGQWQPDGSMVVGGKNFYITIDPHPLKETNYSFYGLNFVGIPERAIATGVMASSGNPKRAKEVLFLKEHNIQPFPNNYIHIHLFGLRSDWLYSLIKNSLNLIGFIRVRLGLAFDPWR